MSGSEATGPARGAEGALEGLVRLAAHLLDAPFAALVRVGPTPAVLAAHGPGAAARLAPLAESHGGHGDGAHVMVPVGREARLVVADDVVRDWDRARIASLADVARAAFALIGPRPEAEPANEEPVSGSWTWDLGSGAVTWSREAMRVLGLVSGGIAPGVNPFVQFAHPDDVDQVREAVGRAVRQRRELAVVYRILPPDGTPRWVRVEAQVVDPDGRGEGSLVMGTCERLVGDGIATSAHARALEEAATRRGRLLAAVVDTMREVAHSDLDVIEMTRRIVRRAMQLTRADGAAFGVPEGDTVQFRASVGLYEASDGPTPVSMGSSLAGFCLESGEVVRCDDTRRDPRADETTMRRFGIRSTIQVPLTYRGSALGVLSVSSRRERAFTEDDAHLLQLMAGVTAALVSHASAFAATSALVAERTRALEGLREAHETLQTVVRASPLAIVTVAPDFRVTTWNPAAERLFGWSAEEVIGQPLPTIPEPESEESRARRLALAAGVDRMQSYETQRRRRDGALIDVATAAATLLDADGRPRGLVEIDLDVTERRKLEARLRQAQRMEAVGQLAGGIAHDFNNLLTIMQLHAEALLEELPPADPLREDAVEIQRQTERAASLTRQLLAFSRKQLLQPRLLDLNATVQDVEKMLRRVIGEDIALETTLDDGLGLVLADPNQLVQVLLNLAVNARDAMPGGGVLGLRTANVSLDEGYGDQHGAVVPAGPYVMLAVSDTGTGMDRATQQRVFEPFFTTKEPGRGTGLGLATVYGIVKQSGGYIWVYSEPGIGTTFKLYMPRVAMDPSPDERRPFVEERGGSETILLVEDDAGLRELARQHLAHLGYTVLVGHGGDEALRLAGEHEGPLHLLMTDVVMPGMSGAALAERLRALRPEARVLFMSGYTDDDIVRRGLLAPRQAMLQKPFSRRALAGAVRRALE
ncbi:MAG TPA: PAS domain S-box protein, partial [Gemmatimonadaceae bacterium]|nr:PAS domain S-box protein [Gemmatimonadaceae bacterium]